MSRVQPTRVWTDPRLLAWSLLMLLASPLLLLAKLKRHFLQGYEWEFDLRRWRVPALTPDRPRARVIFVGAGPGELVMIDRLVELLEARRPDLAVGICLRAIDTLERLAMERPMRRLSLWPFDALPPVARWLRAERPELVVFVDRFRFTTLACGAARAGSDLALVNGRSRRRESPLYRLSAPFYRWQLGGFRLMAMQSRENAEAGRRFASATCQVVDTGSLKADLRRRELSPEARGELLAWLCPDDLPLVAVGSTTDPEEESMALDAFRRLREAMPCRLLLAPRDVRRCGTTLELLAAKGFSVNRRSVGDAPAEVLLLDTFGELAVAYEACAAAYVGGFRGKGGGHNVLEPLEYGIPVAYGPNPGNFDAERRIAESSGGGFAVSDATELADFWLRFVRDDAERERVGAAGKAVLDANRGAFDRTVEAVLKIL